MKNFKTALLCLTISSVLALTGCAGTAPIITDHDHNHESYGVLSRGENAYTKAKSADESTETSTADTATTTDTDTSSTDTTGDTTGTGGNSATESDDNTNNQSSEDTTDNGQSGQQPNNGDAQIGGVSDNDGMNSKSFGRGYGYGENHYTSHPQGSGIDNLGYKGNFGFSAGFQHDSRNVDNHAQGGKEHDSMNFGDQHNFGDHHGHNHGHNHSHGSVNGDHSPQSGYNTNFNSVGGNGQNRSKNCRH